MRRCWRHGDSGHFSFTFVRFCQTQNGSPFLLHQRLANDRVDDALDGGGVGVGRHQLAPRLARSDPRSNGAENGHVDGQFSPAALQLCRVGGGQCNFEQAAVEPGGCRPTPNNRRHAWWQTTSRLWRQPLGAVCFVGPAARSTCAPAAGPVFGKKSRNALGEKWAMSLALDNPALAQVFSQRAKLRWALR